jgi:hypothetical protein
LESGLQESKRGSTAHSSFTGGEAKPLEGPNRRNLTDRRKEATSALSRYTLRGRRGAFRRRSDRQQGGYVDRYKAGLFFTLILIVGLNIFDSVFTMMILDSGGEEVNPVVFSVIGVYGYKFWIWKFLITSFCLIMLCLHSQFKRYKAAYITTAISFIYFIVLIYQILLILSS